MAFSLVLHGSVPKDEICGVIVGHGACFIPLTPFHHFPPKTYFAKEIANPRPFHPQSGISSTTSTPPCTKTNDRSTPPCGGDASLKADRQPPTPAPRQSITKLPPRPRSTCDNSRSRRKSVRQALNPGNLIHCPSYIFLLLGTGRRGGEISRVFLFT